MNLTARSRTFMVPRSHSNQKRMCCCPTRYSESRIGLQIVPLLTHPVAAFTHHPCFPAAEFLSCFSPCGLRQSGKEVIDASSVLDTPVGAVCKEQGSVCLSMKRDAPISGCHPMRTLHEHGLDMFSVCSSKVRSYHRSFRLHISLSSFV